MKQHAKRIRWHSIRMQKCQISEIILEAERSGDWAGPGRCMMRLASLHWESQGPEAGCNYRDIFFLLRCTTWTRKSGC
eukprot:1151155-Pelagomonas_calceolata.AAC.2